MLLAVVDLGSNSFKMTVAQWVPGSGVAQPFRVLHKERYAVQLGKSVFSTGRISGKDRKLALRALARMQARLRDFSAPILRTVATSAIREAKNGREFVEHVRSEIGMPIEIIRGFEEAALIARGLEWEYPKVARGLLVDIGGGSTEIATFGAGWPKDFCHSLKLGSVRVSTQWFDKGKQRDLPRIRASVRKLLKVRPPKGVERLLGSAGTIQSLGEILGIGPQHDLIRLADLDAWIASNLHTGADEFVRRYGVTPSRARVVVPGSIVLSEVLRWLKVREIRVTQMTLRDGLLVDLVGRWHEEESQIRQPTGTRVKHPTNDRLHKEIESVAQRFGVDLMQSHHVASLALSMLDQIVHAKLGTAKFGPQDRRALLAASYLYSVGQIVAQKNYAKHSAYLIRNVEFATLGRDDREFISQVVAAVGEREGAGLEPARRLASILKLVLALDDRNSLSVQSVSLESHKKRTLLAMYRSQPEGADLKQLRQGAKSFEDLFKTKVVPFVHPKRQKARI